MTALPFQCTPRNSGNSLFIDEDFKPYPDQWLFLSKLKKVRTNEIEAIVQEATLKGNIFSVRNSFVDDPWTLLPSGHKFDVPVLESLPKTIKIVQGNLIYLEKEKLPPAAINRLMRIAAFQNPEFYRTQAMRLSTFGKPRIIGCSEVFSKCIGLPRGCFDDVLEIFKKHKVEVEVIDERCPGNPIGVTFHGELSYPQQQAANALLSHENGVLSATTAFGKTVVAAWLIAVRDVNTLILVHRRQLIDQWRERLATFFDLPIKNIGQIGGGKHKPTGIVDIAMIQSLYHKGVVNDLVANYGQVITI
ncbi:Type III restriction enzyme, res subunit [Sporotomaculum syntrophicum]|uniref:Type III restriction enzyme, res subunit n=1 Tax=Sporotomaculum syntrophicum TaxID=182264 RepID=A0A9D3AYK8_9FIRM|nr:DEAD/DEAH box helicase family protein [Sporotomaculum syntrophicum]KAF1086187.1 Type III restriction enzyme, res subunit [Sporotomaculum syntrophicum]